MDWVLFIILIGVIILLIKLYNRLKALMLGIYALKQEIAHLKAEVNSVKLYVSSHTKNEEDHADILAVEEDMKQEADKEFNKDFYSLGIQQ